MRLSKHKCEALKMNAAADVRFEDGTPVPTTHEAKYLGCMMNDRGDVSREISNRLRDSIVTLRRLHPFLRNSNCTTKFKLEVLEAVVTAKVLYGLESAALTQAQQQRLDVFYLKGLRKILRLDTTFVNRDNTNEEVYRRATEAKYEEEVEARRFCKPVLPLSSTYGTRRDAFFARIAVGPNNALRSMALESNSVRQRKRTPRRVGRPRATWAEQSVKSLWTRAQGQGFAPPGAVQLDNDSHCQHLFLYLQYVASTREAQEAIEQIAINEAFEIAWTKTVINSITPLPLFLSTRATPPSPTPWSTGLDGDACIPNRP